MIEQVLLDSNWDQLIKNLPSAHLLQTSEWASVKAKVGWQAFPLIWRGNNQEVCAAALVLIRSLRILKFGPKISLCYCPRGPILDWENEKLRKIVFHDLERFARDKKSLHIKIDPQIITGTGVPGTDTGVDNPVGISVLQEMKNRGWRFSSSQVQFRNTVVLDLEGGEDEWLKRMKQKTRYNLRLAQKNGVLVRIADEAELPQIYKMYAETSVRDGFVIRSQEYYLDVWKTFMQAGMASPLIAEVEGKMVAGLILFHFGETAWYLYGMSTAQLREKMPNYLLQWEAMKVSKNKGCKTYDLWGAPDVFDSSDSMMGVYRFKEGLGGKVIRTGGAWDYVVNPFGFMMFEKILPRVLGLFRKIRKAETRQEISV